MAIGPLLIVMLGVFVGWDLHGSGFNFRSSVMKVGIGGVQRITGPIVLATYPDIVLESAIIPAAQPDDKQGGKAATPSRRVRIDQAVFTVYAGRKPMPSISQDIDRIVPAIVAQMTALDFDELVIRGGTVRLPMDGADAEMLSDVDASFAVSRRGAVSFKAEVSYRGQRLKIASTGTGLGDRHRSGRMPGELTISSVFFDARFEGAATVSRAVQLSGRVELKVPRLRELARWLDIPAPHASNLENAKLRGKLDWSGSAMSFADLSLDMDGNQGTGTLTVAFSKRIPTIEGTVAFKRLDLTPYIRAALIQSSLLAPVGSDAVRRERASTLEAFDADLRISADAVVIPGADAGRGAVAITLKKGRLLADVAELEIEKGLFRGQIEIHGDREPPRFALRGRLDGVEAGRILAPLIDRNPLQGRADVKVDLVSDGGTVDSFLSRLTGKVQLKLLEGGKLGLDLRSLLQTAKRADMRGWPQAGIAGTGVESLEAIVSIQQGSVQTEAVNARSGSLAIGGKGTVDLGRREIDLLIGIDPLDGGQTVAKPGDTIVLKGPLRNPRIWFETANRAAPAKQSP